MDAYLFMAGLPYDRNLDFGDFENFIPLIGGLSIGREFRNRRVKHASHHAICTTKGKHLDYFCTKEAKEQYRNEVDNLNIDFRNQFIIFSDKSDYVLVNDFQDKANIHSLLIKSRAVASLQRTNFSIYSQMAGK